ncbi:uncharacterized protein V6R79_009676 [Siganus canaliculatus]
MHKTSRVVVRSGPVRSQTGVCGVKPPFKNGPGPFAFQPPALSLQRSPPARNQKAQRTRSDAALTLCCTPLPPSGREWSRTTTATTTTTTTTTMTTTFRNMKEEMKFR